MSREENNIKISIITVSRNSEKYIETTILSIINQNYTNIEYIVIDGGSNDNTINIVEKYKNEIDCFISEYDSGIAEAMNKGVARATGDFVLFINSDDYLAHDECINEAISEIKNKPADIHIFKVRFLFNDDREMLSLNKGLGFLTNFKMGSCHQGQFCSRKLFNELGGFDTSLKINFDYDLLLRAYKSGAVSASHQQVVSVMRQVGISSRRDWRGFTERYSEEKLIHFKNCKHNGMRWLYQLYWLLYMPYRYIRYILIFLNKKYLGNKTIKALQ